MPPVEGVEYLTALFVELGIVQGGGMGIAPVSWQEIDSFSRCGHLELTAWETLRLRNMSETYCAWNAKGGQQGDIADDVPYINRKLSATGYLLSQRDKSMETDPL